MDGNHDVIFNIEFLLLEFQKLDNPEENLFEISAYIVEEKSLFSNFNTSDNIPIAKNTYNNKLNIGKIIIKKHQIIEYIKENIYIYIYIIIKKRTNLVYNNIEGQFLFTPINNIYSDIPENYSIYGELEANLSSLHLYSINVTFKSDILVEFWTSGDEVDCKILNKNAYLANSSNVFSDFDEYYIERKRNDKNKILIFINLFDINYNDNIILSIFSKNEGHIAGSDSSKLSYTIKYINIEKNNTNNTNNTNYSPYETQNPLIEKSSLILLGFAKFTLIRIERIYYFFIYFASFKRTFYLNTLYFTAKIRYKKIKNEEQLINIKCDLISYEISTQGKYNCSFLYNGEEIENLEINDDIISNHSIKITKSSVATQYQKKLQEIGNKDFFDGKNNIIIENCTLIVNNSNKEFTLTGNINNQSFEYENIRFNATLLSADNLNETTSEIQCNLNKNNDDIVVLKCKIKDNLEVNLNGASSILEKDNIFINMKEGESGILKFNQTIDEKIHFNKIYAKKNKNGLGTGGIIGIIIACVLVVLILIILLFFLNKKKSNENILNESGLSKIVK